MGLEITDKTGTSGIPPVEDRETQTIEASDVGKVEDVISEDQPTYTRAQMIAMANSVGVDVPDDMSRDELRELTAGMTPATPSGLPESSDPLGSPESSDPLEALRGKILDGVLREPDPDPQVPLENLSRAELVEVAEAKGLEIKSKATKAAIIEAIVDEAIAQDRVIDAAATPGAPEDDFASPLSKEQRQFYREEACGLDGHHTKFNSSDRCQNCGGFR